MRNWGKLLLITYLFAGCKKPYNPPVVNYPNNYLVVEGVINSGSDSTIIKLSRTVNLSNKTTVNPVIGATLTVEGDQNSVYALIERTKGNYISAGLNLDNNHKYRLRIKTADNQQYLSDYEQVKITPPVDSIGFKVIGNNIQLYTNTHDPQNNTHYYRFDYVETWRFHSKYPSSWITTGKDIVIRSAEQQVYTCFANNVSTSILLGSSAALQQDVIYQAPVTTVDLTSEKVEDEYSILLHEYALTPDAYKFWQNLKKNTEQLGSIFDAEPSEIGGNIHNVNNPAETVIGYISVNTVQSKRIFISYTQLPQNLQTIYPYDCTLDTLWVDHPKTHFPDVETYLIPLNSTEIPIEPFYVVGNFNPAGFISSSKECTDCTIRGSNKQPDFWK